MTTQSPEAHTAPSYADEQLNKLLRAHRATVKNNPEARKTLASVETRLKYLLRLLAQWDDLHASKAEDMLALGNIPAANTCATMIFDTQRRAALYDRSRIGFDSADDERLAAVATMGREVLA